MNVFFFYLISILLAGWVTSLAVPILHRLIGKYFLDTPGGLKTHSRPIPVLGGCAVLLGISASLIFIRLTTQFPSGTLHSLRGILWGSTLIFMTGLLDDMRKPAGLSISLKLACQILAVGCLLHYGIHISLIQFPYFSYVLTFLWVIGLTNAFNLLDISDGLCISQACVCALGLCIISLPSERIYVNFAACALIGACIGFWPYNHSRTLKTFLGDSGSTLLGFLLAALAMGADYSQHSHLGFLSPLLIFAIPIFDTSFVSLARLLKGHNPLRASNDHIALRLKKINLSSTQVLYVFLLVALGCNGLAWFASHSPATVAIFLCLLVACFFSLATWYLLRIRINS